MWFGLGKRRSRLGKWLDKKGIKQQELVERSGVSRGTVSKLCSGDAYKPTYKTASKIVKALRQYDAEVAAEDFWDEED